MADPAEALGLRPDAAGGAAPALSRRWSQPWSTGVVRALTALGALAAGFVLSAGLATGRSAAQAEQARKVALVELVTTRQDRADALQAELTELRAQVEVAEQRASSGRPALDRQLRELEVAAGVVGVQGPGLRVTFDDAPGECATGSPEDCRIQDADLQQAVNTLFAVGAEAVAVNDERVIATTAIRSAGGAILVNYRVLTPPYVVEAVGGRTALEAGFLASPLAKDFAIWRDAYGLGFAAEPVEELVVEGFGGSVRLRAAQLPPDPAAPQPGVPS